METFDIRYNHEFISNRVRDELILNSIFNTDPIESSIMKTVQELFHFTIEKGRDINSLSGGQRSLVYLVTLSYICQEKNISGIVLNLINILESLTEKSSITIIDYLTKRGFSVNL